MRLGTNALGLRAHICPTCRYVRPCISLNTSNWPLKLCGHILEYIYSWFMGKHFFRFFGPYKAGLCLNELHPHVRKKHMMLAGLWVDKKHPIPNTFVHPFVQEAKKLYGDGVTWKPNGTNKVTIKFMTLIFGADSGARWNFWGMSQFNGRYGCTLYILLCIRCILGLEIKSR